MRNQTTETIQNVVSSEVLTILNAAAYLGRSAQDTKKARTDKQRLLFSERQVVL